MNKIAMKISITLMAILSSTTILALNQTCPLSYSVTGYNNIDGNYWMPSNDWGITYLSAPKMTAGGAKIAGLPGDKNRSAITSSPYVMLTNKDTDGFYHNVFCRYQNLTNNQYQLTLQKVGAAIKPISPSNWQPGLIPNTVSCSGQGCVFNIQ